MKIDRTGETLCMNCGEKATIKSYRSALDIDVQFEEGVLVEHCTYAHFKEGKIAHPYISTSLKRPSADVQYIMIEIRKQMNMSREEFSNYYCINPRTLKSWEQGDRTPPKYIPGMMARIYQLEAQLPQKILISYFNSYIDSLSEEQKEITGNVSKLVTNLREKYDMTQIQFAEHFSIPAATISHWEQGYREAPSYIPYMMLRIFILENKIEGKQTQ